MFATETQSHLMAPLVVAATLLFISSTTFAQESPYFVTYDHHAEEPGHIEVSVAPLVSSPKRGARSVASTLELEYGTTAWWTTSLYLDAAAPAKTPPLFTGYRFENRFRLMMEERAVNPVLYLEFADTNGADRVIKEVVGFDSWRDLAEPLRAGRKERDREVEAKLILSADRSGWNLAGNLIAEKNLAGPPWEFGYAIGTSRPLALAATPARCWMC